VTVDATPDSRSAIRAAKPATQLPGLNAIVDVETAARAGWRPIDLAQAFLDGGARFLQLRAKAASGAELLEMAAAIVERAHAAGALLVVNDRSDIARLAGADGVHVGQDDLAPRAARSIVGAEAIVGLSTHTVEQLRAALEEPVSPVNPVSPVSYIAVGPVFGTTTKETGREAIGLAMVREASHRAGARGVPLVAIGGITLERAASVIEAGAASVAVISDLLVTGDPERRTRDFLKRIASALSGDRPRCT
jgi:thiamine-phosphate pyrophosphorylase